MRTLPTAILLIGIVGFAACQSPQDGAPTTQTSSPDASNEATATSSASSSTSWPSELPRISDPVDVEHWLEHPCEVLTKKQLDDLDINIKSDSSTGEEDDVASCDWGGLFGDGISFGGYFAPTKATSIPDLYHDDQQGELAFLDPVTINKYPGVFFGRIDDRDRGMCELALGVHDKYIYLIDLTLDRGYPGYRKACTVAKDIGEMAVTTMTDGSS